MCGKFVVSGVVLGCGIVIVALGAGLGWGLFPSAVEKGIANNVALKEGTEAWNVWENTPIPLQFKVYFFHVTNPNPIINNGRKPILEEKGPYVYDEWKWKTDIVLNEDGTLASYYQHTKFVFNETLSGSLKPTDKITVLNAALMGSILTVDMEYPIKSGDNVLKKMDDILDHVFPDDISRHPFMKPTVEDLLFNGVKMNCKDAGFNTPAWLSFCNEVGVMSINSKTIRKELDPDGKPTGDYLYSFFYAKNFTHDGRYTVNTGVKDISLLGWIQEWENETTLPYWHGPHCNQILGTDTTIFRPFLSRESRIDIFTTDLCRSLYATYQRDVEFKGIPGYRYVPDEKQLASVLKEPNNYCWSGPYTGGMANGIIELFDCYDAPVVLTFPHFHLAPENLLTLVDGLAPVQDIHETFLEIEPYTGIPLRGGKRVQFNMLIKPVRLITKTTKLPTALFPIIWIEEGVELDDYYVGRLQSDVMDVIGVLEITRWTLIGVGVATTFVGIGLLLIFWLIA